MEISEVFNLVKEDMELLEEELKRNLNSQIPLMGKAGTYILKSGGKRFRPLMLILTAKYLGYTGSFHIPLASVFEFIHTATLLHDDVVDNAKIRRGGPSVNSIWGNELCVLVGDFLLSKSFSLMVNHGDLRILRILADVTTLMAEGETLQLTHRGNLSIIEPEYISIITDKTARLIAATCQVGAILAGAPLYAERALTQFGLNLGIAFQLMDDVLEYISQEEEWGKAVGKDLREGKITLPLIHTLRKSESKDRREILRGMKRKWLREKDLVLIMELARKYQGIEYAISRAKDYVMEAKGLLSTLDPSLEREALLAAADYVLQRRN